MMQLNYWVLLHVKVNHDFTSNSLKFQFHFSEVYNTKKKKNQSCKHYSFTISPWNNGVNSLLLYEFGFYISNQKGVGDARHIPCQIFSLQSGGSTCFNPTENPAHIAGLLWLLF